MICRFRKILDTQVRHATSNESWVIQNLNLHIQNYDLDPFDLKNNVFAKISDAYLLEVANHNFTVSASVWYLSGYLYFTFDFYKDDRIHILYEQHIKKRKYQQLHQHQFLNIKFLNLILDPDTDLANHTWYQFWPSVLVSYWQNSCNQLIALIEMLLLLTLSHLNSGNQDLWFEFG